MPALIGESKYDYRRLKYKTRPCLVSLQKSKIRTVIKAQNGLRTLGNNNNNNFILPL